MVLGEKTEKENDDRLYGERAERTDQASRTQRAPSAVSSGDSFDCADMCM